MKETKEITSGNINELSAPIIEKVVSLISEELAGASGTCSDFENLVSRVLFMSGTFLINKIKKQEKTLEAFLEKLNVNEEGKERYEYIIKEILKELLEKLNEEDEEEEKEE